MSLRGVLPVVAVLPGYDVATARRDAVAGVTVAALAVPSGIAYAQLAGMPPVAGLYALLLPAVAYALVGSSRQLSIGPEGSIAALVAAAVLPLAAGDPERAAALGALLAVLVGAGFVVVALARLGWLADYLSRPVLVGYLHGVAAVLVIGQLGPLTGIQVAAREPVARLVELVAEITTAHGPTLAVGLSCLVVLLVLPRWAPRLPVSLLVVVAAIAVSALADLAGHGVRVVGAVPSGLPALTVPSGSLDDVFVLLPAAVGIVVVTFADEILTARSYAGRHGQHVRAGQELAAMGLADLAAGLTQAFPVGASGSRTAVNDRSGARTQLAGVFAAAAVLVVLLLLTAPIAVLPVAALGAVIIAAAVGIVDPAAWRELARSSRAELLLAAGTALGVVVFGVLEALVVAVALSLVDVVRRSATPHDAVLGWVERLGRYADVRLHPSAVVEPGVLVYRLDDRLFFANAHYVRGRIREALAAAQPPARWLVFDAETLVDVDAGGARMLAELVEALKAEGVALLLAQSWRQTSWTPGRSSRQARALSSSSARSVASRATTASVTCTSGEPNGPSQCSGAFTPTSPSRPARAAMPSRNSGANVASDAAGTPSASRPR